MPKPNIFNFDTGSSWDPYVTGSVSLTPEVSESIRLLNKTIENYVGIDHNVGTIPIVITAAGLDQETSPFTINVAKPPNNLHPLFKHVVIADFQYTGSSVVEICKPASPRELGYSPVHWTFDPDASILHVYNKTYNSPGTGSNFITLWNVMSGSGGITSQSSYLMGTQGDRPVMGIGTGKPSASLHISSSITGSVTDLFRIQNDFGVPIFKVKPDRILLRNSGSSVNEATMSVDSDNNFMINDTLGVNHTHMFIKSGSKKVRMEVGATSGDLKFKNASTGKELFKIRNSERVLN